jgi:hypothetical protein
MRHADADGREGEKRTGAEESGPVVRDKKNRVLDGPKIHM